MLLQCKRADKVKRLKKLHSRGRIKSARNSILLRFGMSHRSHVGKVMARLLTLLTVLLIATPAFTQERSQEFSENAPEGAETKSTPDPAQERSPVSVSAKIDQSQLKPGQTAKLMITAKLEHGWHLYA